MSTNNATTAFDLVMQSGALSTGNGTPMPVGGLSGVGLQLVLAGTATVTFEVTIDGTNWVAVNAVNLNTLAQATTATASGIYFVPLSGADQLRARISAWTSGAVTVTGKGVLGDMPAQAAALQSGSIGAVSQGSGSSLGAPWFTKLSDGSAALLPAAAALADALANPTTTALEALAGHYNGATWDRVRTPKVFTDVAAVVINSIATVWTPAGGKKFRLMGGALSCNTAINVLFEDNTASAPNFVYRTPTLLAGTPFAFTLGGNGRVSATADNVLKATGSSTGTITGTLYGTEE